MPSTKVSASLGDTCRRGAPSAGRCRSGRRAPAAIGRDPSGSRTRLSPYTEIPASHRRRSPMNRRRFGRTGIEISELTLGGGCVGGLLLHATDVRHGREAPIIANAEMQAEEAPPRTMRTALGERPETRAQTAIRFGLARPAVSTVVFGVADRRSRAGERGARRARPRSARSRGARHVAASKDRRPVPDAGRRLTGGGLDGGDGRWFERRGSPIDRCADPATIRAQS